jgi:ABC-type Fe3+-hydroxamate transport system substrate-binding protein
VRIVSLVPSATETLLAWGSEPIAVTRFCEQGARFETVGGTKDPDVARILELRPDLVVMCDQENRREDAEALSAANVGVHAIRITDLAHVGPQMRMLAERLELDTGLGDACGNFVVPASASPVESASGVRRVFAPIWRKPWMTINGSTYGGSVLAAIGLENIFSAHIDRYPTVSDDEIAAAGPEMVWATSEPYSFTERQRPELERFAPTVFVNGKDLFWWGYRTPLAFHRLAGLANNT